MSLADELLAPVAVTRGSKCSVQIILEELAQTDPDGADALIAVLAGREPSV